jgi:hypothetical protein
MRAYENAVGYYDEDRGEWVIYFREDGTLYDITFKPIVDPSSGRIVNMSVEYGSIISSGWSWGFGDEMPGLLWSRVFRTISRTTSDAIVDLFEKAGITLDVFKKHLLDDIDGVIYGITRDNSMWEWLPGGYYDEIYDYEREFVEENYPDKLEEFENLFPAPREIFDIVKEKIRDDVEKLILDAKALSPLR